MLNRLIKAGAGIRVKDDNGQSPIDIVQSDSEVSVAWMHSEAHPAKPSCCRIS